MVYFSLRIHSTYIDYPAIRSIGRDGMLSLLWFFSFILYGYGFLSRGFTDRREILHGGSAISQTGTGIWGEIVPGMAEFWTSAGAIWRDVLRAEVLFLLSLVSNPLKWIQRHRFPTCQTTPYDSPGTLVF